MKKTTVCLVLLILLFSATVSMAQEVSEKKDVSIFSLSYYQWRIPDSVVGSVDSAVRSLFVEMGRFRVLEVRKRFENDGDLSRFIDSIRELKEKDTEIPEEVSYGHVIFTESDWEQLISSFVVVVPELVSYGLERVRDDDGERKGYECDLRTSYSIIDARTMEVVGKPTIDVKNFDEDREDAINDAVDQTMTRLEFELKKIPMFTIKTGVLEVRGGKITLEKGRNMGIYPGFEFEIISYDELSNGLARDRSVGLVVVSDVFEELSDATVIYGTPREGDQLKEIPRLGSDGIVYLHALVNPFNTDVIEINGALLGLKGIVTRGFYNFRPIVGIEFPLGGLNVYDGLLANVFVGGEINIYMGRLQISPTLEGVFGLYVPRTEDEDASAAHIGAKGYLAINYAITRDVKLQLDIGYAQYITLDEYLFNPYGGIIAGGGIVAKF